MDVIRQKSDENVPLIPGRVYVDKGDNSNEYILIHIDIDGKDEQYAFVGPNDGYTRALWTKEAAQKHVNAMILVKATLTIDF